MRWLPCVLLVTGCATAPPKMSFEEAMRPTSAPAPAPARPEDPLASPPLDEALEAFRTQAEQGRAAVAHGAPMPEAHALAWGRLLDEVDVFLERPLHRSSALDTVRARLQLQTEVENDIQTFGDVPPALAERTTRTLARLQQKLALQTATRHRAVDVARFLWPVEPVLVTSPWGERLHPIVGEYRFHAGLDLVAELAQPVRAAEAGTVVFAGWNAGHGRQIELQHDAHTATRYSHLMTLLVSAGATVRKGDVIGLAGQTGLATGVHLHFELRKDGEPVDPEAALPEPRHRLVVR